MKTTSTGKVDLYSDLDLNKSMQKMNKEVAESRRVEKIEKKSEIEKTSWDKKVEKIKEKELDEILKKLNLNTDIQNRGIRFEKNYDYDRIVVQVIDNETGEMVKQLPPEHVLEFNRLYQEYTGLLFDITV